jgi:hypothetical protein
MSQYLRAWWGREMDRTRVVAAVLCLAGTCLFAVAFASADVPLSDQFPWGLAGATLGISIRAFIDHRAPSAARGFAWAIAYAVAMIAFYLAVIGSAMVLQPALSGVPGLGDAWLEVFAAGFVLLGISAALWERSRTGRELVVLTFIGMGLFFAGLIGLISDQPVFGAPALATGIVLLVLVLTKSHAERQRRASPQSA